MIYDIYLQRSFMFLCTVFHGDLKNIPALLYDIETPWCHRQH